MVNNHPIRWATILEPLPVEPIDIERDYLYEDEAQHGKVNFYKDQVRRGGPYLQELRDERTRLFEMDREDDLEAFACGRCGYHATDARKEAEFNEDMNSPRG